jgi:exopolysaccharide biosynthesis polyprenyl glycosylphosphotransferase
VVVTTFLLVLVGRHVDRWPGELRDVLSLRITVQNLCLLAGFTAAVVFMFRAVGLYEAARVRRWFDELARVFVSTTAIAIALVFLSMRGTHVFDGVALMYFWTASFAGVAVTHAVRASATRSRGRCRRALIVGSGPHALRLCRELSADPSTSYQVLGFVDTHAGPRSLFMTRRTLGSLDDLEAILVREHVDEVHVGLPVRSHYPQIQETIRICERVGVKLMYRADIFDTELARVRVDRAAGATPRVELQVVTDGPLLIAKRSLDILGATVGLIVLAPLMLGIAAAIKLTSAGPVIYAQERYGLNRRRFRMLKFRTMVQDAERLQPLLEARNEAQGPVFKIARDPRVTPLGRWLRRTSLDELPQLINVLAGDMSMVGPRPLPVRDVARFTQAADMRRFSVLPGLTGLWQVSGRSGLGFDQWIKLDLHYIDHWSLVLDLIILARTIPAVLRGTGAA